MSRRSSVSRMREGAADKAATQLVGVQPCQLSVSDMKRRHCPDWVTGRVLRGVKGPAARCVAPRSEQSGGRASVGARRSTNDCSLDIGSPPKLLCGDKSARRTRFPWGETGVLGEATDVSSRGAWRGMGPSTYARVVEITSGRAISQQGLVATCEDLAHKGELEARGGFWSGAWVRTSDDGGVTPSQAIVQVAPLSGNTRRGQRGPGYSVAKEVHAWRDMAGIARSNLPPGSRPRRRTSRPDGKPTGWCTTRLPSRNAWVGVLLLRRGGRQTIGARGVREPALELPPRWAGRLSANVVQGRDQNRTREIRPSGIVGGLREP
jgi:hypothetical protein